MSCVHSSTPDLESCAQRAKCFCFQKQHANKGMDEKKIKKSFKNCPKSPVSWYVINKEDKPDLHDCFEKAVKYCFGSETKIWLG